MLLSAPFLFTKNQTIERGPFFLEIQGDRIVTISTTPTSHARLTQLDDTVLLPGFINAHCHLELTALGSLPYPGSFVRWVEKLVTLKQTQLTPEVMKEGIQRGAKQLMESGVTTLGDHISWNTEWKTIIETPLRGILFGEALGLIPEVAQSLYSALKTIQQEAQNNRWMMTTSPHSVYALNPDILAEVMKKEAAPLSCHISESQEEDDYFANNSGELVQFIQSKGLEKIHTTPTPLNFLQQHGLEKLLIIHANYISDADIALIKQHHLSIVHCPGSHAYFGHKAFPLKKYLDQGINIALGTDSITSNTTLDFLEELRVLKKNHPAISHEAILEMATMNGAKALRMDNEVGTLEVGKKADIIGFKIPSDSSPPEAIFNAKHADFMIIDGKKILGH